MCKSSFKPSLSGYGHDHEIELSEAVAQRFLRGVELPKMGYEVIVVKLPESRGYLALQNISGTYVLASPTHHRDIWEAAFQVALPLHRRSARL